MSESSGNRTGRSCKTKPPRQPLCAVRQSPRLCRASEPGSGSDVAKCQEVSGIVAGTSPFSKTNPTSHSGAPGADALIERLAPRQRAAARLLALGRTVPEIAKELKVARSTIWRWQTLPNFRAELDHLHLWLAGARIGTR